MNKIYPVIVLSLVAVTTDANDDPLSFDADIEVGYGYDSNVSVDDVDLSTNIGDQYADIRLSGDVSYETQNDAEFSASLTLSEKLYDTFDRFDGTLALGSLSASKEWGDWELGLTVRYIDYQLDSDGFLDLTQISPSLSWFPSKKTYLRLTYENSEESYDQNTDRDNDRDEIGVALYYFFNGLRHYVAIQAEIAEEEADSPIFSNDAWQARVSYYRKFRIGEKDTTLKLAYRYQNRAFDDAINPTVRDFREDNRDRYEIEWDVALDDHWSIISEIIYNDYESNLDSADYTQEVYQVTVRYEF